MVGQAKIVAVSKSLLNTATGARAVDIEHRIVAKETEVRDLQAQLVAVRDERGRQKMSSLEITEEILIEFDRKENGLNERIALANEILQALRGQLHAAHYSEWRESKLKRKAVVQERNGALADKRALRIDELVSALVREVSEQERALFDAQEFNQTSNEDVGYVAPGAFRHRGNSPLDIWNRLRRAGFDVPMLTSSVTESPPPRTLQATSQQQLLTTQQKLAVDPRGTLAMTVHGHRPREAPPETDFHGRPLIRTAEEARSADEERRDAEASMSLARKVIRPGA